MSILSSNAFVEGIFTQVKLKWTVVGNRCSNELIEAELQIVVNFSFTYKEFFQNIKNYNRLLRRAKFKDKYKGTQQ